MKSPFVRFSRCVRSPLSLATLGLCTLWGCRHLPNSRHATEYIQPAYAPSAPVVGGYEEPAVADNTALNAGSLPAQNLTVRLQLTPQVDFQGAADVSFKQEPKFALRR